MATRMNTLRRRLKRHRSALTVGLLRVMVYGGLFGLFFGLMSINNWQLRNPSRTLATTLLTYVAMSAAMHTVYGGYDIGRKKSKPLISAMSLSAMVTDLVSYLQLQIMNVNEANNARLVLFGSDFWWLLVCMALQILLIFGMAYWGKRTFFSMNPPQRCLVVTAGAAELMAMRRKIGRYGLQWQITDEARWDEKNLRERITRADVVFLGSEVPDAARMALMQCCYDLHRDVMCKAKLQDIMLSSAHQTIVDDAPFLEMDYAKMTLAQRCMKRGMDIVLSAAVLAVLSPLLAVIAVCIRAEDGGPAIFRQQRMTVGGRVFTISKFRTMKPSAGQEAHPVSAEADDDRITRVGRVLRRFRLDELPQFWNILKGDMTLVGPRPEMLENVERYKRELPAFAYREKMKAGLTGYAQIEGRYNTTPEDKLMLDLMYIENFSMWEDVKLIFRTLTVFFKPESTEGFESTQREAEDDAKRLDA